MREDRSVRETEGEMEEQMEREGERERMRKGLMERERGDEPESRAP